MATNFVSYAKHKPCAIFAIFIPYERVLGVDDRSEIFFFKQKTAYEISACLVGSEMCIRDRYGCMLLVALGCCYHV